MNRKFLLFTAFSWFLPCIVFTALFLAIHFGTNFQFESIAPPPAYYQWFLEMMIYLIVSGLILLGIFFCFQALHLDNVAISFFIGLGRLITLRAALESSRIIANGLGSEYYGFIYTVWVMSDYYFFFLLLSLGSIGLYVTLTLAPSGNLSRKYLTGLFLVGIGGYFLWMEIEKFGVFYIWGINTWSFGIQYSIVLLVIAIGLSMLGFWVTYSRSEKE